MVGDDVDPLPAGVEQLSDPARRSARPPRRGSRRAGRRRRGLDGRSRRPRSTPCPTGHRSRSGRGPATPLLSHERAQHLDRRLRARGRVRRRAGPGPAPSAPSATGTSAGLAVWVTVGSAARLVVASTSRPSAGQAAPAPVGDVEAQPVDEHGDGPRLPSMPAARLRRCRRWPSGRSPPEAPWPRRRATAGTSRPTAADTASRSARSVAAASARSDRVVGAPAALGVVGRQRSRGRRRPAAARSARRAPRAARGRTPAAPGPRSAQTVPRRHACSASSRATSLRAPSGVSAVEVAAGGCGAGPRPSRCPAATLAVARRTARRAAPCGAGPAMPG